MKTIQQQWAGRFNKMGALWIYNGDPRRPHAILTSGMHSNGFFNSEIVFEQPKIADEAANDLVAIFRDHKFQGNPLSLIDRVVGPAMGAITWAHDVARSVPLYRMPTKPCYRSYAEKKPDGSFIFNRTPPQVGEKVLLCEDVITTGESVEKVADVVLATGAELLPFVLTLVNRSGLTDIGGKQIVALIDHPMQRWKPAECPLCPVSEGIRPKGVENWARLNVTH